MSIRFCVPFLSSGLLVAVFLVAGCGVEPGKLDSGEGDAIALESGCALDTPIIDATASFAATRKT